MARLTQNFNSEWLFSKLPVADNFSILPVHKTDFDDTGWEHVTLPHTWNEWDGASGPTGLCEGGEHYYRGLACYRKRFKLSESECADKSIFLEFGAANTVAEVYLNEAFIGSHEGGYSAFRFDITEYVDPKGENIISVKVNNAPTDYIAPITDQGDFTKMGGLYRNVKLITTDKTHIDLSDFGSSGIYVTPKNITSEKADVDLLLKLANDAVYEKALTVSAAFWDMQHNLITTCSKDITISANSKREILLHTEIAHPVLWNGKQNPHLYSAQITLSNGDHILDAYEQRFGIRTYHIDTERGFFLNDTYLDLRGVNYHQDSYENGWAMTDAQRERDYQMMLSMGCTSVRMAHYQHDQYEYDLCDKLGLCVWTELGIVNKMSADETDRLKLSKGFAANAKQQLTELIRQNYNHPSIIVWGISNELYQMSDEIYRLYTELHTLAATEDPTRLRTFADAQFWGKFLELPGDVVGYNRYFGWYKEAGPAEKFGEWLDYYHNEKESRPICVSEYGGGGAISQHKDRIDWETEIDPWGRRHYENYQSAMHEQIWAQFAARNYLWGKYVWCMFDFASDGRQEGDTTGQNDKGLVTRKRIPKDAYYFYKSVWSSSPMVHLTEKRFTERACQIPQIKAYSNADSVELFINDVSMGTVYRTELNPSYPTVFVWNNIAIEADRKNIITVKATMPDRTVHYDNAEWTGCHEASI